MAEERFTIEVIDDSEDVMRNYLGYIEDENGDVLSEVGMYWDELSGEDEDYDEDDDEDSGELPFFEYTVSKNIYRANKEFFDKFAKDKGFKVKIDDYEDDEDDWNGVRIQGHLDVSPTMRTVKKLTSEFLKTLKANGVSPFADGINEGIDPSKIRSVSGGKREDADLNKEAIKIDDVREMGDEEGGRNFLTPIKTLNGQPLVNVSLYEEEGEPCLLMEFNDTWGGVKFYKANKNFFDKYFKNLGLKLIEKKEESYLVYFAFEAREVSKNACKKYASDLASAMSKAGVTKSPVSESFRSRESKLRESLNRSKPKAQSTKKYMDDDISLVDLVSRD